ncbi:transcription elongation factor SPT5-like [Xenia sp. Carnegie-2017]|uniref:transcription elongation factor SPT5-like n=1 Tax=Xenia sp. Carnegie-2017 TaxID=2897299 RepID=UPI001F04CDA1|nr:transcription elongation factor SPT5-like [Xenia sp. Carnegie-2017]XP_046859962.1 transcription elongation factor SPT5-like [Xenia sp. Carnegie-2017]XP_046859963.1 transcription elongation factor SPT5-like [Xenia sp. Carnegie-2017]
MLKERSDEDLEEYYRRKYVETSQKYTKKDYDTPRGIEQQSLLPGVKDPNLWLVKCRIGEERATVIAMMRKAITQQFTDEPLQVKSAIAVEGLKGYIYIEAYKQTHVKQAIEGIGTLKIGQWNQKMVPVQEMTDVLNVVKDLVQLKAKQWVRMKRGIFKDDLAQIDYVHPSKNQVTLKMIPRIDYTKPRGSKALESQEQEKKKRFRRPPQKLFDAEALRSNGGEIHHDGDFSLFEGNRFRQGFLYKNMAISALITEGIKPTLSELEKFESTTDDIDLELPTKSSKDDVTENQFAPGDNVEVVEGELINLQGKIVSIEGSKVVMLPFHEDLKEPLNFPASELRKFFKVGDHVKVIHGKYEGDTGLVLRVLGKTAILFSDLTMHELEVLLKDLQLCSERSSGVDSMGQHQWGDLVQLDPQTVGVIVRIERETFSILTQHGKVVQERQQAVARRKENKHAVALDCDQQTIQVRDIVKVNDGPHKDFQGEVKYVYRGFAFLSCKMVVENGGIIVCRTKQLQLAGGGKAAADSLGGFGGFGGGFVPRSPRISSPAREAGGGTSASPSGRGGGFGRGRGRPGRDQTLIGKTIRISQGPYKGYIGIVKDATETTARVELHSNCKTISVDRSRINIVGAPSRGGSVHSRTPMYGSQTPMYGSQTPGSRTPMYGSQTPTHDGSRTPHYGSMTPSHDGSRTPLHGGAWDPSSSNTPARSENEFDYSLDVPTPSPVGGYGTPNPATPGGFTAPFTPGTPGGIYGSEPSYSPYVDSPSPAGYANPVTPGSANPSPISPAFAPHTPGASLDMEQPHDWVTQDIEVTISDSHQDSQLVSKKGVIRNVVGGTSTVYLYDEKRDVSIPSKHLVPVKPSKQDKVKLIHGDDRESTGTLIQIDGTDAIIKMDSGEQKLVCCDIVSLARLAPTIG